MMQFSNRILIPLAFAFVIQGTAANAHPEKSPPRVSVDFLVAGNPLPTHSDYRGGTFVTVPRWGIEYEIRIRNHDPEDRVVFVIGVDGLSVIDGQRVSQNSSGYVLEPGGSGRIRGWRRGDDRVAAFTFTGREDSYAGRTGRSDNIGQVRVWAIREKSYRPTPKLAEAPARSESKKSADGTRRAGAYHAGGETGTGYGDELVDHVRRTTFIRSNSIQHLHFNYGLGHRYAPPPHDYRGHPESGGDFAPPPPGWSGKRR